MANVPSDLQKIQIEEVGYRSAVSEATFNKMGASINAIIDDGIEPIGTIIQSILTESQFQSIKGNKWVRMSGQSIAGSDLNSLTGISNLPDMITNSAFVRQASVEGNIGVFQADTIVSHSHTTTVSVRDLSGSAPSGDTTICGASGATTNTIASNNTGSTGGSETRPKNYQMNFFIKINNENT